MARRYVPKTYNNRRFLRLFILSIVTLALSFIILFFILFFIFQGYVVDGELDIPWLTDDLPQATTPEPDESPPDAEDADGEGMTEDDENAGGLGGPGDFDNTENQDD